MRLTPRNIRSWARQNDWEGIAGMRLKDVIHDRAFTCTDCAAIFTDRDEVDDEHRCEDCAGDYRRDWGGFDARREYGTWSV